MATSAVLLVARIEARGGVVERVAVENPEPYAFMHGAKAAKYRVEPSLGGAERAHAPGPHGSSLRRSQADARTDSMTLRRITSTTWSRRSSVDVRCTRNVGTCATSRRYRTIISRLRSMSASL